MERQKDKITNMHISPQAVRLEIEQIEKTIQTFIASTTGKKMSPIDFCKTYNKLHLKHTLVCHPVNFHIDVFDSKYPDRVSLENRICFFINKRSINKKVIKIKGSGRGGAFGPYEDMVNIAILNWNHR